MSLLFLQDRAGRYADYCGVGSDVLENNGVCSNYGSSANTDGTQDTCTGTDRDVIFDNRRPLAPLAFSADYYVRRNYNIRTEGGVPVYDNAEALIAERYISADLYRWR
ncbi:hypothetical protein PUN4_620081 [Paraburkholderia unamae]|nr:hypothetical protein PUN4_620081 [Paraburkholderia unamae]